MSGKRDHNHTDMSGTKFPKMSKSQALAGARSSKFSAVWSSRTLAVPEHFQMSAVKASVNTSSTVCGVVESFSQLNLIRPAKGFCEVDNWCSNVSIDKYDLSELISFYGLSSEGERSEVASSRLLEMLLCEGDPGHDLRLRKKFGMQENYQVSFAVDKEICLPDFEKMNMFVHSTNQMPNVAVYVNEILSLVVEVHSSKLSFENTIRKLILVLIDLIRFYSYFTDSFMSCKGIVMPKFQPKKFAVIVTVEFEEFQFKYSLSEINKEHFEDHLHNVFKYNLNRLSSILEIEANEEVEVDAFLFPYFIFLPCSYVDAKFEQIPAREAILFKDIHSNQYKKIPIKEREKNHLIHYAERCKTKKILDGGIPPNLLEIWMDTRSIPKLPIFIYEAVLYDPLNRKEAASCLENLLDQTIYALSALHNDLELVHCDVRLENICFDGEYRAKLIDLDRCSLLGDKVTIYPHSCMYRENIEGILDWLQVACMILWILDDEQTDYHGQKFPTEHQLKDDEFFKGLWNGMFLKDHLSTFKSKFCVDNISIKEVLQKRMINLVSEQDEKET